jgi:hypothetical protein
LILKLDELRRNYGIYVIAFWAVVLGVQNLANLLVVSQTEPSQTLIPTWLFFSYQWISLIFSLGFFAAAIGLGRRTHWGRWLFLIVIGLFFAVSMVGLLTPHFGDPTPLEKWGLGARYVLSVGLPLIYLNLEPVKNKFGTIIEDHIDVN